MQGTFSSELEERGSGSVGQDAAGLGRAEHKICIVVAANCYTVIAVAPKIC